MLTDNDGFAEQPFKHHDATLSKCLVVLDLVRLIALAKLTGFLGFVNTTDDLRPFPEQGTYETRDEYLARITANLGELVDEALPNYTSYLPDGAMPNNGIGPKLMTDHRTSSALLPPTRTFGGEHMAVTVAGVRMELVHAPGETPDQIFVWLPDKGVLMPGDNFYKAFPNLYAIRGTTYRDVRDWVASLDKMRRLRPEHLVPSHTGPLSGSDKIFKALTDYRDAIQFVHDQTVLAMNDGLTPDQAVARVRLPEHLAASPYLTEFYGRVDWSVRSIYTGYLGWFAGNATDLSPLSDDARAGMEAFLNKRKAKFRDD